MVDVGSMPLPKNELTIIILMSRIDTFAGENVHQITTYA